MSALLTDLTLAIRRLRHAPLFTVFAVVTLSLAIGIITAAYTLVRTGLQMNLGLDEADRIVLLAHRSPTNSNLYPSQLSWLDYQAVVAQGHAFDRAAAWATFTNTLVVRDTSEFVNGELVSGGYFGTLGLRPLRGRLLDATDDQPGAAPVVVLSASVWRSRFGRDPAAVGSTVKVGGHPFSVVGVAPDEFCGINMRGGFDRRMVWVPLAAAPQFATRWTRQDPNRRDQAWLSLVAHLAPGRSTADANTDFQSMADRLDASAPLSTVSLSAGPSFAASATYSGSTPKTRGWQAMGANDRVSLTDARDVFRVVLLLPALVLIVACTNLGNFALTRGLARQAEFGIRLAIGASRWQLIRGQLVEYATVALLGAAGGLLVADRLLALVAMAVRSAFGDLPQYRVEVRIDGAVLLAVGGAAVLSTIVAGLIPAIQLTRRTLRQSMPSDSSNTPPQRWRGRSNLIALQLSVSVALLLVTALCIRQLPKLDQGVASGMALDRVGVMNVPFISQTMDEAAVRRTIDGLFSGLQNLPGVTSASASSDRKFAELVDVAIEGRPLAPRNMNSATSRELSVSPAFFHTVGLRLVAGRAFNDRDVAGTERVVIVNETQARTLFGSMQVLGRRLSARGWNDETVTLTVVGVAADTRGTRSARAEVDSTLYVPFAQRYEEYVPIEILARAADGYDASAIATLVRDALRRVNPDVAVAFVGSADAADMGPRTILRYFVIGFGSLALLALGFAASGLYGVLSHVVASRTRELGIRAALGADPVRLVRMVMRDGSRPILEGIVLGLGLAAGARVGMQPWFTDPVTAVDPVAIVIALVPLSTVAALACYLPARRASRVDPNVALRHL